MTIWQEIRSEWQCDLPDIIEGRDPPKLRIDAARRAKGLEPLGDILPDIMKKIRRPL